jgi:hypothetical protein
MKRIDIQELHERPWLPSYLRDYMTDALHGSGGSLPAYRAPPERRG